MKTELSLATTMLLTLVLTLPASAAPADNKTAPTVNVTGSGTKYTTEVTRKTTGEICAADLRQASLLTSQVMGHVNTAILNLADNDKDAAKDVMTKAKSLIGIVRDMLPVTAVTTVVKDAKGKAVYTHTESVQNDVIVLYTGVASIDVLNDILDAKKADVEGEDYLGSVDIYTSVSADLGYIERKVDAALRNLDDPLVAHEQLLLAQINGVDMTIAEAENPLLEARLALQIAEMQVDNKDFESAKDNLSMATIKLDEYRALGGQAKADPIKAISDEIETLKQNIEGNEIAKAIRSCWHKTVQLFDHDNPRTAKAKEVQTKD
jgi:uncharacterized protein (DUF2267 family)